MGDFIEFLREVVLLWRAVKVHITWKTRLIRFEGRLNFAENRTLFATQSKRKHCQKFFLHL